MKAEDQIKLPKVSIIIPAHNQKNVLLECLASVMKLNYARYEVIVVDNASTDGTHKAIKRTFPEVELVRNDKNLGASGGRNLGLKYVDEDSEYILFLDHDIIVEKDLLSKFLEVVMSDSQIGIATPKIYYYDNRSKIWSAGTSISLLTGKVSFNTGNEVDQEQLGKVIDVQVAPAVILVKNKVIEKIGGFDEVYFATYEDTDFCFRARESGYRVVYVSEAKAYHKVPINGSESMKRLLSRAYYIGRNRIIFMKKHSDHFILFLAFLPIYILYYLWFSLFFGRAEGIKNFWKGTLSGLLFVLKNSEHGA